MKRRGKRGSLATIVRVAAGLTQEDVADMAHVDRSGISRLENSQSSVELYATLLEVCGGLPLIDWMIDQLKALREWYLTNEKLGPVLYA